MNVKAKYIYIWLTYRQLSFMTIGSLTRSVIKFEVSLLDTLLISIYISYSAITKFL